MFIKFHELLEKNFYIQPLKGDRVKLSKYKGLIQGRQGNVVECTLGQCQQIVYLALQEFTNFKISETLRRVWLLEDLPANNASSGNVAGFKTPFKPTLQFMGNPVWKVPHSIFSCCIRGKGKFHRYSKYVGEDEFGENIRKFGRKNPKVPMIFQHEKTGEMVFFRRY